MSADSQQEAIAARLRERGLRVEREGAGWRIRATGVDLKAADLRLLRERELRARPRRAPR